MLRTTLWILMLTTLTNGLIAGPRINWTYYDKPKKCWDECKRRVLPQCVEWRRRCDLRTARWEQYHKDLVKTAMNTLSNRIGSDLVINCAKRNRRVSYGVSPSTAQSDANALQFSTPWPRIHLHAYRESINFTGQAYVERKVRGVNGSYLEWSGEPTIDINLSALESSLRNRGFNEAADNLSGTILHELLHQMGHEHPHGYDDGNFMTVISDCVASNGQSARTPGINLATLFLYGPK